MVSGSVASVLHGEPRSTQDVDVVIAPTLPNLRTFVGLVRTDCYVNPESAEEALKERSMFNIVDLDSGWKADLILRKERAFSAAEFERRRRVDLMGIHVSVVSPEDSILSKLEWAKETGSARQLRDAQSIVRVQGARLDLDYLRRWARELGVDEPLQRLLEQIEEDQ